MRRGECESAGDEEREEDRVGGGKREWGGVR